MLIVYCLSKTCKELKKQRSNLKIFLNKHEKARQQIRRASKIPPRFREGGMVELGKGDIDNFLATLDHKTALALDNFPTVNGSELFTRLYADVTR